MDSFFVMLPAVAFWVFLGAIILGPIYMRHREREKMQEVLKVAYEKGTPVPPELITAMQTNLSRMASTPESDLRRAIVLLAVGIGFAGLGYGLWYGLMSVDDTAAYVSGGATAGFGAIPGMIGLAYLILWFTRRKTAKN